MHVMSISHLRPNLWIATLLWHCTDTFRHSLVQLLKLVQKKFGNLVFVASHCQVEWRAALRILQVVCGTMFVDQTLHWILVTFKRCPMKCWVSRKYAQWQLNSLYRFSIRLPELCWFSVHYRAAQFLADSPVTFFWVPWHMHVWPWRGFGPGWSFSDGARALYKIF